jgi:hypothetical protein
MAATIHFIFRRRESECGAAVREENGAGDHDAEDGTRGTDRWSVGVVAAPEMGCGVDDDVENAGADPGEEIVAKEACAAPDELDFAAEHPEHEHVEEDVPDVSDVVEEQIGERLPDAQGGKNSGRDEAKPFEHRPVRCDSLVVINESFEEEDGEIGDEEELHTRSDVEIEADAVAFYTGTGSHSKASVKRGKR